MRGKSFSDSSQFMDICNLLQVIKNRHVFILRHHMIKKFETTYTVYIV